MVGPLIPYTAYFSRESNFAISIAFRIRESLVCSRDLPPLTRVRRFEKSVWRYTSVLPNPNGALSDRIPSNAIATANKEVQPLLTDSTTSLHVYRALVTCRWVGHNRACDHLWVMIRKKSFVKSIFADIREI